jgi:cysteine desulfurase
MSEKPIYLDYNATTPIDPAVREAMLPYLEEEFGNPSSGYVYGQRAKEAVMKAREQVAALIGATPEEIVFTSCGSESDNQAIIGAALASLEKRKSYHHLAHRAPGCNEYLPLPRGEAGLQGDLSAGRWLRISKSG